MPPRCFLAFGLFAAGVSGAVPDLVAADSISNPRPPTPAPTPQISQKSSGPLVEEGFGGRLAYRLYANVGQNNAVNIVPDFSTTGYMGGGVAIPEVPAAVTISPGPGDDLKRIQAAIDRVSKLRMGAGGFRGAVLLTKGTYEVDGSINISTGGVVLCGEGQSDAGTKIIETKKAQSTLIQVSAPGERRENAATKREISTPYVPVGAMQFEVRSAAGYVPGDKIVVVRTPNQKWIDDLVGRQEDFQRKWTPEGYITQYERVVTAVKGNAITIDAPIVQAIEDGYGGGFICKYTFDRIQNVGIEQLLLESTYAGETDEDHGWNAISITNVENGWVRNVTAKFFGYACVQLERGAKYITVQDCAMVDPKSQVTGGRRYSFNINGGSFCLFQRCYTRAGRHDFNTQAKIAGPNVFLDCYADGARSPSGTHHRYGTGALFDNVYCVSFDSHNRGKSGSGHGWSGAQSMYWNCEGSFSNVDAPPGAMSWIIGGKGTLRDRGKAYVEAHGSPVKPRSLYLKQLEDRLGKPAVLNIAVPKQLEGSMWRQLSAWKGNGAPPWSRP
jgi:hypothetical protein